MQWGRIALAATVAIGALGALPAMSAASVAQGGARDDEQTTLTKAERRRFSRAPAVVVNKNLGVFNDELFPIWYLSNPLAERAEEGILEVDDDVTSVSLSPDHRHLALVHEPTAVDAGVVEILDTKNGRTVAEVEYEGDGASGVEWALDGSAFVFVNDLRARYFQSVDGGTVVVERLSDQIGTPLPPPDVAMYQEAARDAIVFATDGDDAGYATCGGIVRAADDVAGGVLYGGLGATPSDPSVKISESDGDCWTLQLTDDEGNPTALVLDDGQLFRLDPSGELAETPTTPPPGLLSQLVSCYVSGIRPPNPGSGLAFVRADSEDGESTHWVYSVDADAYVEVETARGASDACPIPSPDGSQFALATLTDDGDTHTVVGDFESGEVVEVARTGYPIAWSGDGESVLVQGNGTFVVAADGSGGDEASVQIEAGSGSFGDTCRAGDSGRALLVTDEGLVLFDVGQDKATPLPEPRQLGDVCRTTSDDRWLLAGTLLVDLRRGDGIVLPDLDPDTGRNDPPKPPANQPPGGREWYGQPQVTSIAGALNQQPD